eukprot:scaffold115920_cov57-Phaeocystis_antarctica.AAC.1
MDLYPTSIETPFSSYSTYEVPVAERLRRLTRNQLGSARVGSSPTRKEETEKKRNYNEKKETKLHRDGRERQPSGPLVGPDQNMGPGRLATPGSGRCPRVPPNNTIRC